MREERHLVVFLRAPQLGRVKSRLAADIGALPALRFYRETSAGLLRRVARDHRWRCRVALTPDRGVGERWLGPLERQGQGRGDLGRRMARVFAALPPGPAVIIGSDIPAITAAHVWAAFRALGRSDAVFGPAADGGYWLIGLSGRRPLPPGLFAGVRWSSPHAFADTLRTLPHDFRVSALDTLEDVDEGESYRRWRARRTG